MAMMYLTRFRSLRYTCIDIGLWRFVDASTGRTIGPYYSREQELLADLNRFAQVFGE
jgi:hypothetical protein